VILASSVANAVAPGQGHGAPALIFLGECAIVKNIEKKPALPIVNQKAFVKGAIQDAEQSI